MTKKTVFTILIGAVLLPFLAKAQEDKPKKEPSKSIIVDFGEISKTSTPDAVQNQPTYIEYRWAAAADVGGAAVGSATIGLEYAINSSLSVEASGGMTFPGLFSKLDITHSLARNFAPQAFTASTAYWAAKGYDDLEDPLIDDSEFDEKYEIYFKKQTGLSFAAEARYFFEENVFDGWFVGLRGQYHNLNFGTLVPTTGVVTNRTGYDNRTPFYGQQKINLSKDYLDIMAGGGVSGVSYNRLFYSCELNVGARIVTIKGQDSGKKNISNTAFNSQSIQEVRDYNTSFVIPNVTATVRFGYPF
jgi:hypothetical protein